VRNLAVLFFSTPRESLSARQRVHSVNRCMCCLLSCALLVHVLHCNRATRAVRSSAHQQAAEGGSITQELASARRVSVQHMCGKRGSHKDGGCGCESSLSNVQHTEVAVLTAAQSPSSLAVCTFSSGGMPKALDLRLFAIPMALLWLYHFNPCSRARRMTTVLIVVPRCPLLPSRPQVVPPTPLRPSPIPVMMSLFPTISHTCHDLSPRPP
jgi:hypothetical protein